MPTNKQRRQAAQRHLQRQLERRADLARKRRRNAGILLTAIALARMPRFRRRFLACSARRSSWRCR